MMDSIDDKHFPWKGSNKIYDSQQKATDRNGVALNLFDGTYGLNLSECKDEVPSCKLEVMIRKGVHLKLESYDLLQDFRHKNAILLLDYYDEAGNQGRLVIPKIDTAFKIWFDNEGKLLLFDDGHMTSLFKSMIIDFCDLIENLHKQSLVIEKYDPENIYINLSGPLPKLCILLTSVRKVKVLGALDAKRNWDHVRNFIASCEEQCHIKRDDLTEKFCNFIGTNNCKVEKLKNYPDNWDDRRKGEYLMSLAAADHPQMRYLLGSGYMDWPYGNKKRIFDNLPSLICEILDWEENVNHRKYNILEFFNYIILLRNCYKHVLKLPEGVKNVLINREAVIAMIEKWTPDFWIKIYERVGWL